MIISARWCTVLPILCLLLVAGVAGATEGQSPPTPTPTLTVADAASKAGATPGTTACANCYPPSSGPVPPEQVYPLCGVCDTLTYHNGKTSAVKASVLCKGMIDATIFRYQSVGKDFEVRHPDASCSSCTGSGSSDPSTCQLPRLAIYRMHRPDAGTGSFGAGVFCQFDVTMNAFHSMPGRGDVLFMHDPSLYSEQQFDLSTSGDFYASLPANAMRGVVLYDATGAVVTNFDFAATAVATFTSGRTYHFEVVGTGLQARLTAVRDRNGNGITLTYQHAVGSGVSWASFLKIATITDAYGRSAQVTYAPATVAGRYVISRIDLPTGGALQYAYTDPSLSSVSQVTHPDGSQSTFTSIADSASQCVIYRMHDVVDDQGHRDRDLYLTTPTWTNPANGQVQNRSANRARLEINGAGEVEFLSWQDVDPASSVHLFSYIYQGSGSMYRFESYHGYPRSLARATSWSLATPVSSWTWEIVETHTTDGQGRLIGTTSADGRATTFERDAVCHRITRTQQPDGSVATATWTPAANPLTAVDELGRTTVCTYDAAENLLTKTVASGTSAASTWTWTYNARGQVLEARDPLYDPAHPDLHVTTYGYNAAGDLTSVTQAADAAGGTRPVWQYGYDAAGRRTSMTDPVGRVTSFLYDGLNRLVRTTYADGTYEESTYGSGADAGLVVARRDRNGNMTTIAFDGAGRASTTTVAAGTPVAVSEACAYLPGTSQKQSCTKAGSTTTWTYDYDLRQVSSTVSPRAAVNLTTTTQRDIWGRPVATADPYGRTTWQVYDSENRVIRTVRDLLPDGSGIGAAVQAWVAGQGTPGTWVGRSIAEPYGQGSWVPGADSATITSTMYTSVWYTSDRFYYVSQPCAADTTLTARVVDIVGGGTGSQAGLMIRNGLTATAPYAYLFLKGDNTIAFQWRTYTGQGCGLKTIGAGARPQWLRLGRAGDIVTASTSADGSTWTVVATAEPSLGAATEVGLAVAANAATAVTASFENLDLARTTAVTAATRGAYTQQIVAALPRILTANPPYVVETMAYDVAGQMVSRTDGAGSVTTLAYDQQGRLTGQTEAASTVPATTGFAYDVAGNRTAVTSPRGIVTQMTYTGRNLLETVTEAVGTPVAAVVSTKTYTLTGKLATETDALGRVTVYDHGGCCDRLDDITDAAGYITAFTYDGVGNRLTVTDPLTHVTTTAYDARHRPATVTNAAGEITSLAYDDNLTDGVGIDAAGAVMAVLPTLGLGAGADGSAVAVTDPLSNTSYELHDGLGRTVARIDALGHASRVTYDALVGGLVETAMTDALGHVTRARADGAGRAREQVDALGNVATSGFDAAGNQISQRDALGIGWDAMFDARHRQLNRITTRQGVVAETAWGYDLDGNRLSETDALGKTEDYTYDVRNRRTAILDRLTPRGTTRFAYDLVGNLTQISDADNEANGGLANLAGTTQYAYDARNLLKAEAFPTGQQGRTLRVYTYDGGRRLTNRQVGILDGAFSATPAFSGTVTATVYGYDNANRLTTREYGDSLGDGFDYDAAGRLTSASSARYATTVGRLYDAAGRLTSESLTVPDGSIVGTTLTPATWTVGYTYLNDNSLATQTYPTGSVVTRTYTDRHELATVSLGTDRVVQRSYDAAGRLTTSVVGPTPGLHTETRTYVTGDYLVASIAVPGVTGFGYTYDAAGRKLTETDAFAAGGGQTFGYDDAGRLTAWTAGVAATQSWNLTKVGDWTSTTRDGVTEARQNNAVHEATQVGPNILNYDVQGNLTKDEKGTALAWDPENRLLRARVTRDASPTGFGSVAAYRYDALGRRIGKTVDGITTFYLPAGAQTVVEIDRPALPPSQADIDGSQADGALANLAEAPASGGILPGAAGTVTRINFQPATSATPAGFIRDTGKVSAVRTNGLTYGWSADVAAQAVVRGGAVPLVEYDTFVQAQTESSTASWSIALPNGTYPVVVVAGDALSTEQTNHLLIGGVFKEDLTPSAPPGYEAGNFDGYALEVTVTDGTLTIAPGSGAYHAKLCFVEIGAAGTPGTLVTPEITATLAARIAQANAETGANPIVRNGRREYVYGSYVDEVVAYTQTVAGVTKRYYPHYNSLYSVAALTDASGAVVERFTYDAYGKQKITDASGNVTRAKSSVGWDRGFTGYVADSESGLAYARGRMYSPGLGRFVSRDPWRENDYSPTAGDGYVDGFSSYGAWYVPNGLDPFGLEDCWKISRHREKEDNPLPNWPAVRPGFSVEFLDKCKPVCCKSVKLLQWIKDDGGIGWHPDGTKDRVTTQPPLPKRPGRPWHYFDAPTRAGATTYNVTACAYCVKEDGSESLISCVYFSFNRKSGDISVDGGHRPDGTPSDPEDWNHLSPGEQPRPGVPPLVPGKPPKPWWQGHLNPNTVPVGFHGHAF